MGLNNHFMKETNVLKITDRGFTIQVQLFFIWFLHNEKLSGAVHAAAVCSRWFGSTTIY